MKKASGTLPCQSWLVTNGFSGLCHAMRKNPEPFAHIKQEKRIRRPEEWVPVAEQLAADNDGLLPTPWWLQKNGYMSVYRAMRQAPEAFAHLKRDKTKKDHALDECVAVAEHVASENGGAIPYAEQLRKMGLGRLAHAIHKHPERFTHLKQAGVLDKWVPIAERLVEEHGILPGLKWLEKNGYNGLRMAFRRKPELFAHIQRAPDNQRPGKSNWFLFWVPFANNLAQEHKGKLPSDKWLTKHNYQGLVLAKQQHPELFAEVTT